MHPPVALIALPMEPVDTVRSALLLRNTVPAVQALGHTLRDDIDALNEITQAVRAARAKIEAERAGLVEQRATLAKLTTQKVEMARTARRALHDLQEQAERLGKEARDLRDLVARLARRPAPARPRKEVRPKPPVPATGEQAALPPRAADGLPVRGRIARQFDEQNASGQRSRGVVIDAKPQSTVVAPRDGEVVFAGPFRGLGNLLIIEYHAKYHLLLAGLARIDTQVGEKVLAGEPVGVMQTTEDQGTALYMELRRNGQPINPLPWLAAGRTRVNG
jgi:septal ring factor EnvC (AmiA/AmiB activator)